MRGHPEQIVYAKDTGYELDVTALEKILLAENVRDKKVVILSVAGAYRKGKSFLLSFLLRYLEAEGASNWMGNPRKPLKGFNWKGGSEGCTSGILMWSEPFIINTPNHEEVAVILLDTQGAFDTNYDMGECATVFALSVMVSSVQVYNIMHNIEETDLHHLQLFTEYGRIAQEQGSSNKPFQRLMFLIRDWFHTHEAVHGIDGGEVYLSGKLSSASRDKSELQLVRQHIKSCFSEINCFLMPFPGEEVAGGSTFDGRLSGISELFKKHLEDLVPLLLSPENLVIKRIGGIDVTAKELSRHFQMYMKMFQGDKLPAPLTIFEGTARANNQVAAERAKDHYITIMDEMCCSGKPSMSSTELQDKHQELKKVAITQFQITSKIGERQFSGEYEQQLIRELDKIYDDYKKSNDVKLIHEEAMNEMERKFREEMEKQMRKENLQKAVYQAKEYYKTRMNEVCYSGKPSMSSTELLDKHQEVREAAITHFQNTSKTEGRQYSYEYEQQLITELDKMYDDYKKFNKAKLRHEDDMKKMEQQFKDELEKQMQKEKLRNAVNQAKEYYKTCMDQICDSGNPSMSLIRLHEKHQELKASAIVQFQILSEFGERLVTHEYEQQLITELDKMYDDYKKSNKAKLMYEDVLKEMQQKFNKELEKHMQKENLQNAVNQAKEYYKTHMRKICCSGKPSMRSTELQDKHQELKEASIRQFQITCKWKDTQISHEYEQHLSTELDKMYENYKNANEDKLRHEEAIQEMERKLREEWEKQMRKENLQKAANHAREYYKTRMDQMCCSGMLWMNPTELQDTHQNVKADAIAQFQIASKRGQRQYTCEYEQQLILDLDKMFADYKKSNEERLRHKEKMNKMEIKLREELDKRLQKENLQNSVNQAKEYYKTRMDEICSEKPSMNFTELQDKHQELKEAAITQFHITSKTEGRQFSCEYEQQLAMELDKMYDEYKKSNKDKLAHEEAMKYMEQKLKEELEKQMQKENLPKAVNHAKEYYKARMDEICFPGNPSISSTELLDKHQELKEAAIIQFQITTKMGDRRFSCEYEQQLITDLDMMYEDYKKSNEEKLRQEIIQNAVDQAMEYYKTCMDEICCSGKPLMSSTEFEEKHQELKESAITQFQITCNMEENQFCEYEQHLNTEFDTMYDDYKKSNDEKLRYEEAMKEMERKLMEELEKQIQKENLQKAVNHAKEYYKTHMDEICLGKPSMSSTELQEKHELYTNSAITQFQDAIKIGGIQFSENHEMELFKEMDKMYDDYVKSNEEKLRQEILRNAVNDAKKYYKTGMDEICFSGNPSMSSKEIQDKHQELKEAAIAQFQVTSNIGERQLTYAYEQELLTELHMMFVDYKKSNDDKLRHEEAMKEMERKYAEELEKQMQKESLERAVNHAKEHYKTCMDEICFGKPSMSSTELQEKHELHTNTAITQFKEAIEIVEKQFSENYEMELFKELEKMHDDYARSNEEKLRQENLQKAAKHAKEYYKTCMDEVCCSRKPSISFTDLQHNHQELRDAAITQFQITSKLDEWQFAYEYEQQLIMELDKMYDDYKKSNEDKLRHEEAMKNLERKLREESEKQLQKEILQKAVNYAKEYYKTRMDEICLGKPLMTSAELQEKLEIHKNTAISQFQVTVHIGEKQLFDNYEKELFKGLDKMFDNYVTSNDEKLRQESIQKAVDRAKEFYKIRMDEICLGKPSISFTALQDEHQKLKEVAVEEFQQTNELLEEQFPDKYVQELIMELDNMHNNFKKLNEERRKYENEQERKRNNLIKIVVAVVAVVVIAAVAVQLCV